MPTLVLISRASTSSTREVWHVRWSAEPRTGCGVRIPDDRIVLTRPLRDLPSIPLRLRCARCAQ